MYFQTMQGLTLKYLDAAAHDSTHAAADAISSLVLAGTPCVRAAVCSHPPGSPMSISVGGSAPRCNSAPCGGGGVDSCPCLSLTVRPLTVAKERNPGRTNSRIKERQPCPWSLARAAVPGCCRRLASGAAALLGDAASSSHPPLQGVRARLRPRLRGTSEAACQAPTRNSRIVAPRRGAQRGCAALPGRQTYRQPRVETRSQTGQLRPARQQAR